MHWVYRRRRKRRNRHEGCERQSHHYFKYNQREVLAPDNDPGPLVICNVSTFYNNIKLFIPVDHFYFMLLSHQ